MRELTIDELIIYLRRRIIKKNLDFIAQAQNPWHALGINASLNNSERGKSGVIILKPHGVSGLHVKKDNFRITDQDEVEFICLDLDRKVTFFETVAGAVSTTTSFWKSRKVANKQSNTVDIITPTNPDQEINRYRPYARIFANKSVLRHAIPKYVFIDPGLSQIKTPPMNKGGENQIQSLTERTLRWIYTSCEKTTSQRYFKRMPSTNLNLFQLSDGVLEVRKEAISDYRSILPTISGEQKRGVVLTQPLVELGILEKSDQLELIRSPIQSLTDAEFEIFLKPHPREDPSIYEDLDKANDNLTLVTEHQEAIEAQLGDIDPSIVVGAFSSALITCNALYDIPVFSNIRKIAELTSLSGWQDYANLFLEIMQGFVRPFDESAIEAKLNKQ